MIFPPVHVHEGCNDSRFIAPGTTLPRERNTNADSPQAGTSLAGCTDDSSTGPTKYSIHLRLREIFHTCMQEKARVPEQRHIERSQHIPGHKYVFLTISLMFRDNLDFLFSNKLP